VDLDSIGVSIYLVTKKGKTNTGYQTPNPREQWRARNTITQ